MFSSDKFGKKQSNKKRKKKKLLKIKTISKVFFLFSLESISSKGKLGDFISLKKKKEKTKWFFLDDVIMNYIQTRNEEIRYISSAWD